MTAQDIVFLAAYPFCDAVGQVQFSPDGRWIVSASFDKSVKLWDGLKGTFVASFRGHVRPVYQVSWSADSRLVVSGSSDSTLKVHPVPPHLQSVLLTVSFNSLGCLSTAPCGLSVSALTAP